MKQEQERDMRCKHCGSSKLQKRGKLNQRFMGITKSVHRYQCKECGRFVQTEPRHSRSAKILLLDIETLYSEFAAWSPAQGWIPHEALLRDWCVLCYAAKWLFEPEIKGKILTPEEARKRSDARILEDIWRLMDQADIIVTQNGINFDIKKLNARFIQNGFPPPSQYMNVDTKKVASEVFGFTYNGLDFLGKMFGIGAKEKMEFNDWIECSNGNKTYLDKMLYYCKGDVAPLLEDVYLKFIPWMRTHPNLGVYADHTGDVCPRCESQDLSWGSKIYATPQGAWEGWRCNACGAIGRGHGKDHKIKQVNITSVMPK